MSRIWVERPDPRKVQGAPKEQRQFTEAQLVEQAQAILLAKRRMLKLIRGGGYASTVS